MAEPMRSGNKTARFSYADDIGILVIGKLLAESAASAQREVDNLLEWAQENAVAFDTEKSDVIYFPRYRRGNVIDIRVNGRNIASSEYIRWLGVYLDSKLSFKHYVAIWCGKALKAAQQIRRLNSVKIGATPGPLVTAVDTCIIPVATYGADF